MIGYLEKFNKLPGDIRDTVSKQETVEAINALEQKYKISLAMIVMRVMVKDISLVDLAKFFVFENNFEVKQAEELVEELKIKVFKDAAAYLGFDSDFGTDDSAAAPPAAPVRSSNFYFSPEDEEEVKELARIMGTGNKKEMEKKEENNKEFLAIVDIISKELNFNFSSDELRKRFNSVVLTYVKGIRNKLDTKSTLIKGVETGGLGLNEALSIKSMAAADRIMMEQKNNKSEPLLEPARDKLSKDKPNASTVEHSGTALDKAVINKKEQPKAPAVNRDMVYDFKALKEKEVVAPGSGPEKVDGRMDKKTALDMHTINLRKNNSAKPPKDKPKEPLTETKVPANIAVGPRIASLSNGKKRVEDVKYVPKLTGPVDELKEMDIINFRRLNPDARIATGKIIEKIKFLEDDGYEKRLAGISAWRKSPANKLYLAIGQNSIDSQKNVDTVIAERQANKEDYLTPREFIAIMDLNKALRF
ncbi:hypothetical protein KAR28_03605 [Candidatus Parcubacteria bacterium]|nr:hypothetical protein [Candidatus Parcubacteria bacterium]